MDNSSILPNSFWVTPEDQIIFERNEKNRKRISYAAFIPAFFTALGYGAVRLNQFLKFLEYIDAIDDVDDIKWPVKLGCFPFFIVTTLVLKWKTNLEYLTGVEEAGGIINSILTHIKENILGSLWVLISALCEGVIIFACINEILSGEENHYNSLSLTLGIFIAIFSVFQFLMAEGRLLIAFHDKRYFSRDSMYQSFPGDMFDTHLNVGNLDFDAYRAPGRYRRIRCNFCHKGFLSNLLINSSISLGSVAVFALSFHSIVSLVEGASGADTQNIQFGVGVVGLFYALADLALYGGTLKNYYYRLVYPSDGYKQIFCGSSSRIALTIICSIWSFLIGITYYMALRDTLLFVKKNEDATYNPFFITVASIIVLMRMVAFLWVEGIKFIRTISSSWYSYFNETNLSYVDGLLPQDNMRKPTNTLLLITAKFVCVVGLGALLEQIITENHSSKESAVSYLIAVLLSAFIGFKKPVDNRSKCVIAFKICVEVLSVTFFGLAAQLIAKDNGMENASSEMIGKIFAGTISVIVHLLFTKYIIELPPEVGILREAEHQIYHDVPVVPN